MPIGMFTRPNIQALGACLFHRIIPLMLQHSTDENTLLITSTLGPLKYVLKHAKKALYPFLDSNESYVNTIVIEIKVH